MRKHIDGQELEDATVSFMTAVTRRAKIVSLIIFGMLAAGIGAKFFGGVVTYFGLEEKMVRAGDGSGLPRGSDRRSLGLRSWKMRPSIV